MFHSEHLWSGISNDAPFQRLVDKIKAMQQYSAENKAKRPRNETIDIVTGAVECSDDEWTWGNFGRSCNK
jgi:hypothetical protein